MRLSDDDLDLIDRGASISGLTRTEFMRNAAVQEAQLAVLNETVLRVPPTAFEEIIDSLKEPVVAHPSKLRERLSRPAPWKN
jgi:uncharacterized protein (DUF1778 family)